MGKKTKENAKPQEPSRVVPYLRNEDSFQIAAEATPAQVRQWAEDWYNLWTLQVCHADKSKRRVEPFILCCSRLAAVAELQKLNPTPLLTFIREMGEAWVSGRMPTKQDSHLGEAQDVVERVDSWAKGSREIAPTDARRTVEQRALSMMDDNGRQILGIAADDTRTVDQKMRDIVTL